VTKLSYFIAFQFDLSVVSGFASFIGGCNILPQKVSKEKNKCF